MATIECYANPVRLFRYRSLYHFDREVEAIERGYLFCSSYKKLNDPMEGLFKSSRLLKKHANYRSLISALIDNKSRTGVCSFSEVYDHELMWAHYANQFRGICIGYRVSQLLEKLGRGVSLVRLYYNEQVPRLLPTKADPSLLARRVLSYKNYRWSYEREWRMFAEQGPASYGRTSCVSHVYLGSQISPDHRERIVKVLKRLNIKISMMVIDEYSIGFEDYNESSKYLFKM